MPPTPTPTAEQIESVREIAQLYSFTQTETLINGRGDGIHNGLNDAQWLRTLQDIELWEGGVKDDDVEIKNGLLGANISPNQTRERLQNRLRGRLGLPSLDSVCGGSYVVSTPLSADTDCGC